ncbi:putative helicase ARIP4 isoform X3 [Trypanosoma conorhini]|uniref:Putative helicase ARIP4 isoform X3 n=1 Tax=Trypanosoma conorhini TaxID=83891 RepID=A0A3R7NSN8_9TRYP|nr:putative helicase ARIP4 isoform X3 [Trypanosoma conorhini]RNF22889.1 putative helicase ARIP4 isoform X3 [Trypanosoma conorhini]
MEVVLLAAHKLQLLSELGGVCAVPAQSSSRSEEWHALKPAYVRHGPLNNYRRCRLTARFFCSMDGTVLSSANETRGSNGAHSPVILLLPLGRDPVENSGVIAFKMANEGPLMSRRHCVLQLSSSCLLCVPHDSREWCAINVRDCCSLNGTFVNGRRLAAGASSPPVVFDPCDARAWREPLLTLELGAGAKLAPGAPLSERQALLRLHVFARFIGERQDVGWIQRRLRGVCFSKLAPGGAAPHLSQNEHSVCSLLAASVPVELTTEALGKEECGNCVHSEEVLTSPCEACAAAAQRILLLNAGSAEAVDANVYPSTLPRCHNPSGPQCLGSPSPTHRPESGAADNDAEESMLREACVNYAAALPRDASAHLVKSAEKKGTPRRKKCNKAASPAKRRVRDSFFDYPVDVGLTARDAAPRRTPLGEGGAGKIGDCGLPRSASTRTGLVSESLLASRDVGGSPSSPLQESLLDFSPVLVKKPFLARSSPLEPPARECRVANTSRSVSLPAAAPCKEGSRMVSPTRAPPKPVNAANGDMTAEREEVAVMSDAVRHQLEGGLTVTAQTLSWRSGSCSLPTSQDDRVVALPRRGMVTVKEEAASEGEELAGDARSITVSASPPPCAPALGAGSAESPGKKTRKRGGKRKRAADSKETVKMFIAELLDGTDGASPHERE